MEAAALGQITNTPMKLEREFRAELANIGVAWNSLKHVLPDWIDSAFQGRSGIVELKTFLSRNAGLQLTSDGHLTTSNFRLRASRLTLLLLWNRLRQLAAWRPHARVWWQEQLQSHTLVYLKKQMCFVQTC